MAPTKDQFTAAIERFVTIFVTWLLTWTTSKGYITTAQAAEFAPLVLPIGGGLYGLWVAKKSNILLAASNIEGTTIVTTPDLAAATPTASNVISNTESKVTINQTVEDNKEHIS